MIASPKNFIEQFQNFIEHIAGVMNGLVSSKKAQTFTEAEKKQARDNIGASRITVDSALSATSENPVQNKVINSAFDGINSTLDGINSALDGKLSTSGGTVNGPVTIASTITTSEIARPAGVKEFHIHGKDNDGCIQLVPGNDGSFAGKKSASLYLTSTGYTGNTIGVGSFVLSAMNATTGVKSLSGEPNGSLTWGGTFSATTLKATSDKRKKTNITETSADLSAIKAYRYKFKEPSEVDKGFHVGLIAQEVEKILPEAVSKDEKGFLTLDYNAVVAVLVDEVNQLKSEIKQLQAKLS